MEGWRREGSSSLGLGGVPVCQALYFPPCQLLRLGTGKVGFVLKDSGPLLEILPRPLGETLHQFRQLWIGGSDILVHPISSSLRTLRLGEAGTMGRPNIRYPVRSLPFLLPSLHKGDGSGGELYRLIRKVLQAVSRLGYHLERSEWPPATKHLEQAFWRLPSIAESPPSISPCKERT